MEDDDLRDLLNPFWHEKLASFIQRQRNVQTYLGRARPKTFPNREDTFRALNILPPEQWKVVLFGQDPYPREASAVGIAFCDGQIRRWTDSFSPSFRNIIKNLLICAGLLERSDKIQAFRQVVKQHRVVAPPDWFLRTAEQGVLWLNTSLTFTSTDSADLRRHMQFWAPIIERIVQTLLESKRDTPDAPPGIVFVLWGGHAQKLRTMIVRINRAIGVPVRFVTANHPAVESFHAVRSFTSIREAQLELGQEPVRWLLKLDDGATNKGKTKAKATKPAAVAPPSEPEPEPEQAEAEDEAAEAKRTRSTRRKRARTDAD